MRNTRMDESQVGINIAGRNNNLRCAEDTTLIAESIEKLKSLLMRVKEESEKAGLKLNIKKKTLSSWHLVTSLHGKYKGKNWKQWQTVFLGFKITVDSDCNHEIKRRLLLGRKAMTNICVYVSSITNLCLTRYDPMDSSPSGSSVHGIPQARILEWGCHFLLQMIFPAQGLNPRLLHLLDSMLKSRDITLLAKVHTVKAMVFPYVRMWELDHKEG